MQLTIRAAELADANRLDVCLDDAFEVFTWSGRTPVEALTRAITLCPMAWTAEMTHADGTTSILAVFGCGPTETPGVGCPWLLSSVASRSIPMSFLRATQRHIKTMHQEFHTLINYVHSHNSKSIQWLQWLGFSFGHLVIPPGSTSSFIQFTKTINVRL